MKRLKRNVVMILTAVLVVLAAIPVYASTSTPRWSYLTMMTAYMDVNDYGYAQVSVTCDATGTGVDKIKTKCELQQLDGSWKTIKKWEVTEEDYITKYTKSYGIKKNYSYRIKVTAYMYVDSKLVETVTETFDQGYYQ